MHNSNFIKGIATGLVVGAAAAMIIDPINDRQKNKIVKKTRGVSKNVGSMIDAAVDMMR